MPSFNLIDEPWIPVYGLDGRAECSIKEVLLRAQEFREMRDSSPLVTLALHRLFLAILHRNFGPSSSKAWGKLWQTGCFDAAALESYFARSRPYFDLFDAERPFYQDAAFQSKKPNGINQLVRELSRGNNPTLFDHTSEDPPPLLSPAEAARALVAEQAFAVGGGKSELGYTTSGPLVGGVTVLVCGENLFETLLLNLIRYKENDPLPTEGDAPAWEQKGRPKDGPPTPNGYLDYLTWQSRSIHLQPEADGRVRFMSYAQGRKLAPAAPLYDPMMAYQRDKEGDRPLRLSETKALWRESAALFQFEAEATAFRGPGNLRWLRDLRAEDLLPSRPRFTLTAVGLCTDKAKVHFWRHEDLPLPPDYLTDGTLKKSLQVALELAEEVGAKLRNGATRKLAELLLTAGQRSPDSKQLWAMVDSLGADALYWSRLEQPFRLFLINLPGPVAHQKEQIDAWFRDRLARTARRAFWETAGELGSSRRILRAVVESERQLGGSLAKIARTAKIHQPLPQETPA
jgi:CRISPR system Cascade subunit CasA